MASITVMDRASVVEDLEGNLASHTNYLTRPRIRASFTPLGEYLLAAFTMRMAINVKCKFY